MARKKKIDVQNMSELTKQRLRALKLFIELKDYDAVAQEMGIPPATVEKWILKFKDEDYDNIVDAAMVLTSQKSIEILLNVLDAMNDPEKIQKANLAQLATVAGILTDKINVMIGRPTSVSKKVASIDLKAFEKVKKGYMS